MTITSRPFGVTAAGDAVTCYRLESVSGAWAEVLDYGGIIRAVSVPDRGGALRNVCYGYETPAEYESGGDYLGAVVGRCAGRIGGGVFQLHGRICRLAVNQPPNHLHGGERGFDRRLWQAVCTPQALLLRRTSPDGEEGYPGSLAVEVRYSWDAPDTLTVAFTARAGAADTVVSLTHHGYWNLAGADAPAGNQTFQAFSSSYTAVDRTGLPTGELLPVDGTPFDFRAPKALSQDWDASHPQLVAAGGYDHTFLLPGDGLRPAGVLCSPDSGVHMEVSTTLPGLHLYTGNGMTPRRAAVALEAQFLPDAVHQPRFPSVVLPAGEEWRHSISYAFSCT